MEMTNSSQNIVFPIQARFEGKTTFAHTLHLPLPSPLNVASKHTLRPYLDTICGGKGRGVRRRLWNGRWQKVRGNEQMLAFSKSCLCRQDKIWQWQITMDPSPSLSLQSNFVSKQGIVLITLSLLFPSLQILLSIQGLRVCLDTIVRWKGRGGRRRWWSGK